MKHADRVAVESTVQEYVKVGRKPSRPFVVMLDGNRIGDFDDEDDANDVRLDVIRSLDAGWPLAALRERFGKLSVLHAKLSAEYRAMANELGIADTAALGAK